MAEVPSPIPINGPNASEEETVERGMARFISVTRERDSLKAKVDVLDIDLQAKDAELKAMRDMLAFSEEQSKLREAETQNRVANYQNDRDDAVAKLAKSEQRFEDLFKTIVGCLQAFRAQGGELVKQATDKP
jgi:hypothetical protein